MTQLSLPNTSKKQELLASLFNEHTKKMIMVALDDSAITGPELGLRDMQAAVDTAVAQNPEAIMGFAGMFMRYGESMGQVRGVLNITLSTDGSHHLNKVLVGAVEDTHDLGLTAVSAHVNMTAPDEPAMLANFGQIAFACRKQGIPLLAHIYPRRIIDGREDHYQDLRDSEPEKYALLVRHGARVAADLGADIIKVPYTGSVETFRTVVESCYGLPVLMAGGPLIAKQDFLQNVYGAMQAGARGLAIGRNYFKQPSHEEGGQMLSMVRSIVHEGKTPENVLALY